MKAFTKIYLILAVLTGVVLFGGCAEEIQDEITEITLGRCLEPMELSAKIAQGNLVTFSWDVTKDAESYVLVVYTDKEMTEEYLSETLSAAQVPYTKALEADATYYYKVQATNTTKGLQPSKWGVYEKAIETYAVKDNLYLEVSERNASSISFAWSTDVSDYLEVDRIEYGLPGCEDEDILSYNLTESDKTSGTATIPELAAATEYVFTLYYKSAARGEVDAWTTPDISGLTEVSSVEGLQNALKTAGAKILLKMSGSPYTYTSEAVQDIVGAVQIIGEGAADGSKPAIYGEFHITSEFSGGSISFEGVELNGANSTTRGFPIQLKNGGGIKTAVAIDAITFRNCTITGYSKGLIYEWSQPMNIGTMEWNSCEISAINADGIGGGDVIDIRGTATSPLSTIGDIKLINNTLYNGGRTYVRIDFPVSLNSIRLENNTLYNLCLSDNTNNAGIIATQTKPTSETVVKNNLFIGMGEKAMLGSASTAKEGGFDGYKYLGSGAMTFSGNYYYNVSENFFNSNFTQSDAIGGGGAILTEDPCWNSKATQFNITNSDLTSAKIGASKWWVPYVEKSEDLTLGKVEGKHTWNLFDAKLFSGTIKKEMVRDLLYINANSENNITASDEGLLFSTATVTSKKGVPTSGYFAFKVSEPGSVLLKAVDTEVNGGHVIVASGPLDGSSITVKGGASAMADMTNAQKILVKDITEECFIYVYVSGPVGISALAWSTDVSPVNTALPAPKPVANPETITSGEAEDVVISWEPVENAGSYSIVFGGKNYTADDVSEGENPRFTVAKTTVGMLDPGVYTVEVYANPSETDIYNTMSEVGTASFAIQPKSDGGEEDSEFVVKSVEELTAALAAGKTEISVAPGTYELTEAIITPANLILKNQTGEERPQITGSIKIRGTELGDIVFEGLELVGNASNGNCFTVSNVTGDKAEGNAAEVTVSATSVTVRNCYIHDYSKSVWYNPAGNKSSYESAIGLLRIENNIIKSCTTGQNTIDIRDGHYDDVRVEHNTFDGCAVSGADLIRIDDTQNGLVEIPTFVVKNNTIYNCANASGKAILYVREKFNSFNFSRNLVLCSEGSVGKLSRSAVVKPALSDNFYFNPGANFFTGDITEDGTVLTASPVKNASDGDFTLTNSVVISSNAGARCWNPNYTEKVSSSVSVKDIDELTAALSAGKTSISLASGEYVLNSPLTCIAGLTLSGESETDRPVIIGSIKIAGENNGNLTFENIVFQGNASNGNCITVSNKTGDGATDFVSARTVSLRNCQFKDYSKSVWYNPKGNRTTVESDISSVVFEGCRFTDCTTGQNTIDIRDGKYTSFTISNCTFESCAVSGAELIRIDNGHNGLVEMDGLVIKNNTIYNCSSASGKALLYVRENLNNYIFQNNVIIGTASSAGLFARARVALGEDYIAPALSGNFFFSVGANMFGENDDIKADYGTLLSTSPVKDAENGNYTLTSALLMSCNAGARCWNPTAGSPVNPSEFFSVSSQDEFDAAVSAGKTNIILKINDEGYSLSAFKVVEGMNLRGEIKNGKKPVITGSFKIAGTVGNLSFENLELVGDSSNGNCFTVSNVTGDGATDYVKGGNILIRNCDIHNYSKTIWYNPKGNRTTSESEITSVKISGCTIKDCTTGQNTIDVRDGIYGTFTVENNTFVNCAVSGAELFRVDYTQNGLVDMGAMVIKNNTIYNCSAASGKAVLYNRAPFSAYTVSGNLIIGTAEHEGLFARARVALGESFIAPDLTGNCFYSVGANMFGEKDDIKADYGTVLTEDPCVDAANGNFKLKTSLAVGDPRWR